MANGELWQSLISFWCDAITLSCNWRRVSNNIWANFKEIFICCALCGSHRIYFGQSMWHETSRFIKLVTSGKIAYDFGFGLSSSVDVENAQWISNENIVSYIFALIARYSTSRCTRLLIIHIGRNLSTKTETFDVGRCCVFLFCFTMQAFRSRDVNRPHMIVQCTHTPHARLSCEASGVEKNGL